MIDRNGSGRRQLALVFAIVLGLAAFGLHRDVAEGAVYIQQAMSRASGTAGETLAEGDVVMIKSADGLVYKADADVTTLRPALGVIGKGGASGAAVEIVTRGIVGGLSSLTKGAPIYLSTTAGGTTQSMPAAYGQQLGYALTATQMLLEVSPANDTLADSAVATAKIAAGAVVPSKLSLLVRNETGGDLAAGDLVYVSGWSEAQTRFLVTKADADAAGARATYVMQGALANNTNGTAYKTYRLTAQNTNGSTVGDAIYLSTTAGGWTASAPTGADDINQIVGRVAVVSATVGEIEFDLVSNNTPISTGTNELQALGVTTAKLATGAATSAKLSAGAKTHTVLISLPDPGGADADIAAGYVLWSPSVNLTITKAYHIPQAAWVAAAAANDGSVVITNAAVGAVATLSVVTALAAGSLNDMGAITNAAVVAGTNVTIAVTANGTANAPASLVQIEYTTTD